MTVLVGLALWVLGGVAGVAAGAAARELGFLGWLVERRRPAGRHVLPDPGAGPPLPPEPLPLLPVAEELAGWQRATIAGYIARAGTWPAGTRRAGRILADSLRLAGPLRDLGIARLLLILGAQVDELRHADVGDDQIAAAIECAMVELTAVDRMEPVS